MTHATGNKTKTFRAKAMPNIRYFPSDLSLPLTLYSLRRGLTEGPELHRLTDIPRSAQNDKKGSDRPTLNIANMRCILDRTASPL